MPPIKRFALGIIGTAIAGHTIERQHIIPLPQPHNVPRIIASLTGQLGLGVVDLFAFKRTPALPRVIFMFKNTLATAMQELAGAIGGIPALPKRLGHQNDLRVFFVPPLVTVVVHTRLERLTAGENGVSRRTTQWCGAMSVGKANSSLGQAIHVGRNRLRMPTETADPIVQIVNGDE